MQHAPAAVAALPLLIGSATALLLWQALASHVPVVAAGAAAIALLAAAACTATDDAPGACVSIVVGCLAGGLAVGWIAADRAYGPPLLKRFAREQPSEPVSLEGVLREDATTTDFGVSLALDVDRVGSERTRGGVRVSVIGSLSARASTEWRRGRRLRLPAALRYPSVYHDPGVADERGALARRGICLVGSVKSAALVEQLETASRLQELASSARAWTRRRIRAAMMPVDERSAAITTAILIGDRSSLSDEDERRLQAAGTYHVIAISGGNIAILTALLLFGARAAFLPPAMAAVATILALVFYGLITGPAPSVGRAVTAAVIFLAARAVDHRGPPLNALAVAAFTIVSAAPVAVFDPGFILSFAATLGILLGVPILTGAPSRSRGGVIRRTVQSIKWGLMAILAATICAELALAPVGASLFGRMTFAGLVLNFVAIPMMTVVQLAGMGILVSWDSSRASDGFVRLAHAAASGLVESARLVDLAPWLSGPVRPPSWPMLCAYYTAVVAMVPPFHRRVAAACAAAIGALIVMGPAAWARDAVPPSKYPLRVVVLDVGQGDATLILAGGGQALLVDAGGTAAHFSMAAGEASPAFDVGDRVVVPALRALDVETLQAMVLTHGDPDHLLGAPAVLRAFDVRSIWEGVPVPPHPGLQELRRSATADRVAWRTVQAGDREAFGNVEVRVLHPPPPEWERQRIRNEDSVVLDVRLGRVSIVLAGDIGREGEHAILSRLDRGRLTVLKAGHHGSATSSTPELLAAMRPVAVVFSAGRDNRFGHPHPSVEARFEGIGTAVFGTDRDGAVFIETDGEEVQIRGWTGRAATFRTAPAGAPTTTRRHDGTKE